ncbi:MAG: 16S rRNA (uracil(1498)-N(3))-methyltransferase [Nitrospirae bacterium]|nr:16S rRNA (uracil(1498)-N(3))-methyltransferase [Nitrospirota bacterium]
MTRIFLTPSQLASNEIKITGDNAKYLFLVLRIKPGELITILDGEARKYTCKVLDADKKVVRVAKINEEPYSGESPIFITLAQGIAKGDKMDFIIQKTTELGVKNIVPVITERSQIRETGKIARWRRIALSASQQSGREFIPEIEPPLKLEEFVCRKNQCSKIIFSEKQKGGNLKHVLSTINNPKHFLLLIGPEGGFSEGEIKLASDNGFIEASLGPRILRTETSPIAAISIIQYELGDMGN